MQKGKKKGLKNKKLFPEEKLFIFITDFSKIYWF